MHSDAAGVQLFYERYPYPPPGEPLDRYRALWEDGQLRRQDHHLFWPARPFRDDHSILVAGCGTSQAAKYAMRWPAARVTGIDFSAASVRCTEALKRTHHLDNLHVRQLPIERAAELETTFDQIVCTGVLHHLADPGAGLRALRQVLEPDGAMLVMVYAPYGRAGIYMMQEFCRRVGIGATEDGVRDLIATLGALPLGHPLSRLRDAPDFHRTSAIADALLHPRDRAYSVPQLFDFIANAGLTFGRWIKQAPYSAQCGVVAQLPQTSRLRELSLVEQYAAVELFRGTMVRHSAIVYRSDGPSGGRELSFVEDPCLDYVPIRMPDTICVRDRLPPGAEAVLINRSHTYTDIVLAIDALEARLFEAVDGNRCLRQIVEDALPGQPRRFDIGRQFFERLWLYDQIAIGTA